MAWWAHTGSANGTRFCNRDKSARLLTDHVVHPRSHLVETELIALDVLHHEAGLVAAIGRQ
jgi:hypothetical protein